MVNQWQQFALGSRLVTYICDTKIVMNYKSLCVKCDNKNVANHASKNEKACVNCYKVNSLKTYDGFFYDKKNEISSYLRVF